MKPLIAGSTTFTIKENTPAPSKAPLNALRPTCSVWELLQITSTTTFAKWPALVHEGKYVAEVDIELIDTPEGCLPYLTLEDAYKLDDVREALRKGDLDSASRLARLYTLTPVTVWNRWITNTFTADRAESDTTLGFKVRCYKILRFHSRAIWLYWN